MTPSLQPRSRRVRLHKEQVLDEETGLWVPAWFECPWCRVIPFYYTPTTKRETQFLFWLVYHAGICDERPPIPRPDAGAYLVEEVQRAAEIRRNLRRRVKPKLRLDQLDGERDCW